MFQLNFLDKKKTQQQTSKTKQTKERKIEGKKERKKENIRGKMFNVQII